MTRIFITGSHGFIGSRLVSAIVKHFKNSQICEYDLAYGQDIRNEFQLSKEIELFQPDVIIHLAALAGVRRSEEYPEEYYSTNILGTENVFKAAKKHGVKKVISFSSSSVFGTNGYPISVYGISKNAGEQIARKSWESRDSWNDALRSVYVVRPYTVYGENGRNDQVIRKWIVKILDAQPIDFYGNGDTFRPYTYVGDLVEAVCKMVECNQEGFHEFDISGSEKITLSELLSLFEYHCKKWGINLSINNQEQPKVDPRGNEVNTGKAYSMLKWIPKTDFKKKLKSILKQELYNVWKQNH